MTDEEMNQIRLEMSYALLMGRLYKYHVTREALELALQCRSREKQARERCMEATSGLYIGERR